MVVPTVLAIDPASWPILKKRRLTRRLPCGAEPCGSTGMSRTVLAPLFLSITIVAAAQNASDFTARYGYSDAERFVVRPGITLLASYAEDRTACEMIIDPKHSLVLQRDDKDQSMVTAA